MMHDFLHQVAPCGILFIAVPPDMRADAEAIAAGPWLPGWQLSFMPLDSSPFDEDATGSIGWSTCRSRWPASA